MRLCLRGQDIGWITIGVRRNDGVTQWKRVDARPEQFLNSVLHLLKSWKVGLDDLTSVAVVTGPGSFTALRDSLTIANTIAYARSLPVASLTAKPTDEDAVVMERLTKARTRTAAWAVPRYGAPANITKAKAKQLHA